MVVVPVNQLTILPEQPEVFFLTMIQLTVLKISVSEFSWEVSIGGTTSTHLLQIHTFPNLYFSFSQANQMVVNHRI